MRDERRSLKRSLWLAPIMLALSACQALGSIPYAPARMPAEWLQMQPYAVIHLGSTRFILTQPSSTVFVYLLGCTAIGAGLRFFRLRAGQRARSWWAAALILWGLGALAAGTSYQAFSYEIKCAGRLICSWTSWWEIAYLLLSVASVDAMLVAGALSSSTGRMRKRMIAWAAANLLLYLVALGVGLATLNTFLLSFELLLLFAAPNIVALFALNLRRYLRLKQDEDRVLVTAWTILGLTLAAYFLYLSLDLTAGLWQRGIWFSENDVLHIGLIGWMLYLGLQAVRLIEDQRGGHDRPHPRA